MQYKIPTLSERYGLNPEMEEEELASADAVGKRLATIITNAGRLSCKDAIAIVWNEFGGRYTYNCKNLWLGLRKDVRESMHSFAPGDIYCNAYHQWTSRKYVGRLLTVATGKDRGGLSEK